MYLDQTILAIVGARSGSKGLPGKNLKDLGGKPLLRWTLDAAMGSALIDRIIVSTDAEEYADAARVAGLEVPFLRPPELATDQSSIYDVIAHTIDWLWKHEERRYDWIVLLQPTSPFRTSQHIDDAVRMLLDHPDADTLVSVCKAPEKLGWLLCEEAGYVELCLGSGKEKPNRQSLPTYYLPNGAVFIGSAKERIDSFYGSRTLRYEMTEDDSIDIDLPEDLESARDRLERQGANDG